MAGFVAAVLGKPVAHSLSPVLHRAAYTALGLTDWDYHAIECDADGLARLVASSAANVVGYSCTMPLKRQVLRVADSASSEASAIGAGNTLLAIEGQWFADNTDWVGVRNALLERRVALTGRTTVLGAGGTAQAVIAALADSGAGEVTVLVRDPARTAELRATAERLRVGVVIGSLADPRALADAELVVSTLPAGAADSLAARSWRQDQALLDVVYAPWPTDLAESMRAAGCTVVSGAAMLLHQAARQVELMTGRTAPIEAMRAAMSAAVPGCAG